MERRVKHRCLLLAPRSLLQAPCSTLQQKRPGANGRGDCIFNHYYRGIPQKPEADLNAGWLEKGDVWPVLATAGAGC